MIESSKEPISKKDAALASAGLRWFDTMRTETEWGLSIDEQLRLLGGVDRQLFLEWLEVAIQYEPVYLDCQAFHRLSLLLGIYQSFKAIAPHNKRSMGAVWFNTPNSNLLFSGKSPKEFLLESGSVSAMLELRGYLGRVSL